MFLREEPVSRQNLQNLGSINGTDGMRISEVEKPPVKLELPKDRVRRKRAHVALKDVKLRGDFEIRVGIDFGTDGSGIFFLSFSFYQSIQRKPKRTKQSGRRREGRCMHTNGGSDGVGGRKPKRIYF